MAKGNALLNERLQKDETKATGIFNSRGVYYDTPRGGESLDVKRDETTKTRANPHKYDVSTVLKTI